MNEIARETNNPNEQKKRQEREEKLSLEISF